MTSFADPVVISYALRPKEPASIASRLRRFRPVGSVVSVILMFCVIGASICGGLYVRRMAWEMAVEIHFKTMLGNAIFWGNQANQVGYTNLYQQWYDKTGGNLANQPGGGHLALDYPPLRLLVMAKWAQWASEKNELAEDRAAADDLRNIQSEHLRKHTPPALTKLDLARLQQHALQRRNALHWQGDYEFNRPMLQLNTACEFTGAVAMFLLVHYWLRKCSGAPARQWVQPMRCAWPALFSALLVWFSPALIFNAHSYPQWDAWIVPPFLLAVYFGFLDLWLISGICVGVVAMGKGQILVVMPAIILWQLFMFRGLSVARLSKVVTVGLIKQQNVKAPATALLELLFAPLGVVLRLGTGILLAAGAIASPWLLDNAAARLWMALLLLNALFLIPLFFLRKRSLDSIVAVAGLSLVSFALVMWPWYSNPRPPFAGSVFLVFVGSIIAARFLPRRWAPSLCAMTLAGGVFFCAALFNTSMVWYDIGIKFPTEHWQMLQWCHAMNLGGLLDIKYHWQYASIINLADYLPFLQSHSFDLVGNLIPRPKTSGVPADADWRIMPMRYLMIGSYLFCILLCAIGMAWHARRKNRTFFFAMVAPWVLMFTLLPQMQNRYSLWAAVFAAATVSFSSEGFLLYLLLNALNFVNTAYDMLSWAGGTETSVRWLPLVHPLFPDLGWATLLIAGIFLYLALRNDRVSIRRLGTAQAPPESIDPQKTAPVFTSPVAQQPAAETGRDSAPIRSPSDRTDPVIPQGIQLA